MEGVRDWDGGTEGQGNKIPKPKKAEDVRRQLGSSEAETQMEN